MKFSVNLLPAKYGDCIWIEYGEAGALNRILIDGGTGGTRHVINELLSELPEEERHFELIVVTHIDRDHIEGVLGLLEEDELSFTVGDFWFNGWSHLPGNNEDEFYGAVQGERLTAAILKHKLSWNAAFNNKTIVVREDEELPSIVLPGGMNITLLSPQVNGLERLRPKWEAEVIKHGLKPGFGAEEPEEETSDIERFGIDINVEKLNDEAFKEDRAEANGSSIAFLAEFGGKSVLFSGDAYPSVVLESLNKLFEEKAPISLMKLSHHGSSHNTSPELIEKLNCNKYIISTNGSIYHHPNRETIAWVIMRGGDSPKLIFNYTSDENEVWNEDAIKQLHNYNTAYPENEGIVIKLL